MNVKFISQLSSTCGRERTEALQNNGNVDLGSKPTLQTVFWLGIAGWYLCQSRGKTAWHSRH